LSDHREHIELFGRLFENQIIRLVDLNYKANTNFMNEIKNQKDQEFIAEIIEQAQLRIKNASFVMGRDCQEEIVI
jgi:hypothetical protein